MTAMSRSRSTSCRDAAAARRDSPWSSASLLPCCGGHLLEPILLGLEAQGLGNHLSSRGEQRMITRHSCKQGLLSIAAVLSMIVLSGPADTAQLAHEGFRLSFPDYANGGTGFSGPWLGTGFTTRSKSLCVSGFDGSVGGSIAGDGLGAFAQRPLLSPFGADGTTVYVSFLIQ